MSRRSQLLPYGLSAPGVLMLMALIVLPMIMTLSLSFHLPAPDGTPGDAFTLSNYSDVFRDKYFHEIFGRTFGMSAAVTLLCILIGVPEALVLSRLGERMRAVSMVIVLGPLLVSVVVRTLGWAVLLGSEGIISNVLMATHLIETPIDLMFTLTGVVIAMTHVLVPLMVIAIWASLQKLDPAAEQAAESLGAGFFTVLCRIIFPQIIPGVLSGSLIVFALAASAFATPSIIGGRRLKMVPTSVYDEFLSNMNWPLGATLALLLLLIVLGVSMAVNRFIERRYRQVFQ